MRVLLLSTSYPRDASDWRGIFIRHLVYALARDEALEMTVWSPPGEMPNRVHYAATPEEAQWLSRVMEAGGIAHLLRSRRLRGFSVALRLVGRLRSACRRASHVDLYHANWLQTALALPDDGKPALVTVLGTDLKLLRLPFMRPMLRRVMRHRRVVICPNAEWMKDPLDAAFGDVASVQPVPFGIDPQWFAIRRAPDRDQPSWLVVTRLTRDKLGPLFSWGAPLFEGQGRRLDLFGPMQEQVDVPAWVNYHGPATSDELAQKWFPGAHGLITLSRHAEGRPQVMLEAMAAGLPIIATDMPAHAGIVDPGTTGALCVDQAGFAEALVRLEDIELNERYGGAARRWVTGAIGTWDDCAARYTTIYRRLLESDGA